MANAYNQSGRHANFRSPSRQAPLPQARPQGNLRTKVAYRAATKGSGPPVYAIVFMTSLDFPHGTVAFTSAFLAGAINSVAGGGTLVSFPTLIWLGLPSVTANATSTVAIWPASVSSMFGYRREVRSTPMRMLLLVIPSLLGGIVGALLLRWTPPDRKST